MFKCCSRCGSMNDLWRTRVKNVYAVNCGKCLRVREARRNDSLQGLFVPSAVPQARVAGPLGGSRRKDLYALIPRAYR